MKTLNMPFNDKDFKKLKSAYKSKKILGESTSWQDFILKLAGIRK